MVTPINTVNPIPHAASSGGSSSSSSSSTSASSDPLAQEQTFLQLLVAQVQNQDPMDTSTDPTEFVTELAQFSQLEQLSDIHSDLDTLVSAGQTSSTKSTQENG
jgi:flagellar basal-body rod modification protein FlgD